MLKRFSIGVIELTAKNINSKKILSRFSIGLKNINRYNSNNKKLLSRFSIIMKDSIPDKVEIRRFKKLL